jgi:hypothetical protein
MSQKTGKILFERLGFIEDPQFGVLFRHHQLPQFEFYKSGKNLKVMVNREYDIDLGKIPFREENIRAFLKAYNIEA